MSDSRRRYRDLNSQFLTHSAVDILYPEMDVVHPFLYSIDVSLILFFNLIEITDEFRGYPVNPCIHSGSVIPRRGRYDYHCNDIAHHVEGQFSHVNAR